MLIDFDGEVVLTDPWFVDAPYFHHGEALGSGVDDLPRLAAIVASHAHFDHYHIEGLAAYPHKDVPVIVGFEDMAVRARQAGFTNVFVLRPGEVIHAGAIKILALPGAHGVPEITFLLRSGGSSVYFGGDTLLTPEVRRIASYAPIDVALLSVNGLRTMGKPVVMSATQAAVFADMLGATVAIPMHYTFRGGPHTEGILTYHSTAEEFITTSNAPLRERSGASSNPVRHNASSDDRSAFNAAFRSATSCSAMLPPLAHREGIHHGQQPGVQLTLSAAVARALLALMCADALPEFATPIVREMVDA